jgi:hypothetical protein
MRPRSSGPPFAEIIPLEGGHHFKQCAVPGSFGNEIEIYVRPGQKCLRGHFLVGY